MSTKAPPPAIAVTGFDFDHPITQRFETLRGRISSSLSPTSHTSILVCAVPVRRTFKLLLAAARGSWIVGEEYLDAAAAGRGAFVDPAPYEMFALLPGAAKSRQAGGGASCIGLEVTLRGSGTSVPEDSLIALLKAAGATVRVGRDGTGLKPLEVHRAADHSRIADADEAWLLDRIMQGGERGGRRALAQRQQQQPFASAASAEQPAESSRGRRSRPLSDGSKCSLARTEAATEAEAEAVVEAAEAEAAVAVASAAEGKARPRARAGSENVLPEATPTALAPARSKRHCTTEPPPAAQPPAPPPPPDEAPTRQPKRARRGSSILPSGDSAAADAPEEVLECPAPASSAAAGRLPTGMECTLLPPPGCSPLAGEFSVPEALAIHLYRQRLPECNVDLPGACSPRHPGLGGRDGCVDDFLQL